MRNLVFFLFFLTHLVLQTQMYANDDHFWIGDKRVSILKDKSSIVIIFKQDKISLNTPQLYKNLPNISEAVISADQKTVVLSYEKEQTDSEIEIIMSMGLSLDYVEWYSFCYLADGIEILKPTNKISFRMLSSIDSKELETYIKNKATFDKTYFGTPQLRILTPNIDIISLSNEIYESGLVEYCYPDFIANITHYDDPLYPQQYYLRAVPKIGIKKDIE